MGIHDIQFVLGAADPEMAAIERLLREAGLRVIHALGPDGARVRPADAYRVAALSEPIPAGATVYRVECDGPAIPTDAVVIDHHRPGDPGYGRPPAEFMATSSIGQVVQILASQDRIPRDWEYAATGSSFGEDDVELFGPHGRRRALSRFGDDDLRAVGAPVALGSPSVDGCVYDEPTGSWWVHWGSGGCDVGDWDLAAKIPADLVLIAAADHCLAAAYRGECPGVDPDALMRWRAESRARFQRRAVEDVLADVERARAALMDAPVVRLSPEPWEPACGVHGRTGACWQSGGPDPSVRTDACYAMGDPLLVVDMRGRHVPELPEASAREGVCFIADGLPGPDGRVKIVCQSGTPAQIDAFMRVWAPAQGLEDIYGDPARGFAGGYVKRG